MEEKRNLRKERVGVVTSNKMVRISETRPLSKTKCWRLVEILERAK
jgi:small subunit ribosomal protein S17